MRLAIRFLFLAAIIARVDGAEPNNAPLEFARAKLAKAEKSAEIRR